MTFLPVPSETVVAAEQQEPLDAMSVLQGSKQRRGFIPAYLAGYFGMQIALLATTVVSLPLRVAQLDPTHKAQTIAIVAIIAGTVAIIATPLAGRLSDRSMSRFGIRKPFLVGGVLLGGLALFGVGLAPSIPMILILWCVVQIGFAANTATLSALLADQIPHVIRARVSAGLGAAQAIATVGGGFLVAAVGNIPLLWFAVPASIAIVLNLVLALTLKDIVRKVPAAKFDRKMFLSTYWVSPRENPDFAWAWVCRLFNYSSVAMLSTYILYFITDTVHVPAAKAASSTGIALVAYFAAGMLSIFFMAWISDRTGRRKVIVICAGLTTAAGLLVTTTASSFEMALIGIAIAGLGQGAYLSADLALMVEVLPKANDAGKDLGIVSLSQLMTQLVAPAVALPILAISPGNYRALFATAIVFSVIGGLAVIPVKQVR